MRLLPTLGLALAACLVSAGTAFAQTSIGPPIPTDQILRQQNRPLPPPPSPPVPAQSSTPTSPSAVPSRRARSGRDPVSRCQHEATVKRVPRSQRQAYIHSCMQD